MTEPITITIPAPFMRPVRNGKTGKLRVPSPWINANVRYHRMAKANLTKLWRDAGAVAARDLEPLPTPVRIVAHIWKARYGRYDVNNLADTTKAIVDGLVDAGLLVDDSFQHVIGPDHRHGGKGEPRVVLTITPAAPAPGRSD